jgi:C-terminal processing protease CtpA/Prc
VLIDEETSSSAENMVLTIKGLGRGLIIGSPTFGSFGQSLSVLLPGNELARICTTKTLTMDNEDVSEKGIMPDILVKPTIDGLIKGEDEVLNFAIKKMQQLIGRK